MSDVFRDVFFPGLDIVGVLDIATVNLVGRKGNQGVIAEQCV